MKTSFKLFAISLFTLLSVISTHVAKSQVSASISFSVFHDNLQAYGRWVSHSRYGQVWIPGVSGFRPYSTGGHWAYTDFGWTWVSDYEWGWAPFHYGRWAYDPMYGWVWIPGYQWGPAWVSWRTGGDYYGWAPLGPDISIGIGVSFGTTIPADYWIFVPNRYITSPVVYRYYAPRTKNVTIIRNTTIINNTRETNVFNQKTVVVGGPRKEDVERVAHTKVLVMHVSDATKPSREVVDRSRNTINVYRPVINKTTINKNVTVNKTTVNKNTKKTENNNKKVTNRSVNTETVNNNKTVNKEANKAKEANRTTAKKVTNKKTGGREVNDNDKNISEDKKQVQKNAAPDSNEQNAVKPAENDRQDENRRTVEKKPAPKQNERQVHKPGNNDSDNDKPKKPQGSVGLNDKNAKLMAIDQNQTKMADSNSVSEKNQNKNEVRNNHLKTKER